MPVCDVLIIGSGIAGLSLAIKLSKEFPNRKIFMVTKATEADSNTWRAQGGMSVVCNTDDDTFDNHIRDTLNAGDGLCDVDIVKRVVEQGPMALLELIGAGVDFDRDKTGKFKLAQEGGHSRARIVHYKDMSGFQIAVSLLVTANAMPGISMLPHHTAIDLLTGTTHQGKYCNGAVIFDNKRNRFEAYYSRVTVLATGGLGEVYGITTNPAIATGDGIAIACRAGAKIKHMEFIQFHPTAFFLNDKGPHFLITEALRGFGAYLRNSKGNRFMFNYDQRGELACRDVLSRAIEDQISPCVYLDCRHLPSDKLIATFPKVYSHCSARGIEIDKDLIPVIPAAHYLCGGIDVSASGVSSIDRLYAVGECAHTGLHGANRLASNSLLEAVTFAEFCFQDIRSKINALPDHDDVRRNKWRYQVIQSTVGMRLIRERIQKLMSKHAGITRTTEGLKHAQRYLDIIETGLQDIYENSFSLELQELKNLVTCAKLIVAQSLERKVNKGVFYNRDLDVNCAIEGDSDKVYF